MRWCEEIVLIPFIYTRVFSDYEYSLDVQQRRGWWITEVGGCSQSVLKGSRALSVTWRGPLGYISQTSAYSSQQLWHLCTFFAVRHSMATKYVVGPRVHCSVMYHACGLYSENLIIQALDGRILSHLKGWVNHDSSNNVGISPRIMFLLKMVWHWIFLWYREIHLISRHAFYLNHGIIVGIAAGGFTIYWDLLNWPDQNTVRTVQNIDLVRGVHPSVFMLLTSNIDMPT
jgi:hypothetical protein